MTGNRVECLLMLRICQVKYWLQRISWKNIKKKLKWRKGRQQLFPKRTVSEGDAICSMQEHIHRWTKGYNNVNQIFKGIYHQNILAELAAQTHFSKLTIIIYLLVNVNAITYSCINSVRRVEKVSSIIHSLPCISPWMSEFSSSFQFHPRKWPSSPQLHNMEKVLNFPNIFSAIAIICSKTSTYLSYLDICQMSL